jgi:hypothetical protein
MPVNMRQQVSLKCWYPSTEACSVIIPDDSSPVDCCCEYLVSQNRSQCFNISVKMYSNPITAMDRPIGFQEFETPRFLRHLAHEGDKVVSPMHQLPLPPGNITGTHLF